ERAMADKNIQSALLEKRTFTPPPGFAARARAKPADLEMLRKRARDDHAGFCADLASQEPTLPTPSTVALDATQAPNYRWSGPGAEGSQRRPGGQARDRCRRRLARRPRGRAQGGGRPGARQALQERAAGDRAQAHRPADQHGSEPRPVVA